VEKKAVNWTLVGMFAVLIVAFWWMAIDLSSRRLEGYVCAAIMTLLLGTLILDALGVVEVRIGKRK
jgi:ABC-type transport system involved in cytochrome c biogenesis permease component